MTFVTDRFAASASQLHIDEVRRHFGRLVDLDEFALWCARQNLAWDPQSASYRVAQPDDASGAPQL